MIETKTFRFIALCPKDPSLRNKWGLYEETMHTHNFVWGMENNAYWGLFEVEPEGDKFKVVRFRGFDPQVTSPGEWHSYRIDLDAALQSHQVLVKNDLTNSPDEPWLVTGFYL